MTKLVHASLAPIRAVKDFFNPPTPEGPPQPVIPDEEELKRQQRLLASQKATKSGRLSTILSEPPPDAFGS